MESFIQEPGYWTIEAAQKRADRLNARELDSYSYYVKPIRMHSKSNDLAEGSRASDLS